MIFDEHVLVAAIDPCECVNSKAIHVTIIARNTNIVQQPREHVHALGVMREEVPNAPPLLLIAQLQRSVTDDVTGTAPLTGLGLKA